jgi:anti-sigma B factor antagonist
VRMQASTRRVKDVAIVDLSGQIKLGEDSSLLRSTVSDLLGKGEKKILLNLGDTTYIDSSGIGVLVGALHFSSEAGRGVETSEVDKRRCMT